MKRDSPLMLAILAVAEETAGTVGLDALAHLSDDPRSIAYQVHQLHEMGYVKAVMSLDHNRVPNGGVILDVTPDGHAYLNEHGGCTTPTSSATIRSELLRLAGQQNLPALTEQCARLLDVARSDPALAIGTSKEMLETVCKSILTDRKIHFDKNTKFPKLVKEARNALTLFPQHGPNQPTASSQVDQAVSAVSQLANAVNMLRNTHGTGHGHGGTANSLTDRHARFVVGSTTALACFLLESHAATP